MGQYTGRLNLKRRVAIPKKFIQKLGNRPIMAKWYENCLVLVSNEGWKELLKRIGSSQKLMIAPVRDIDRFVSGSAFELEADIQGRVIIPDILSKFAGLGEEVVFLGLGDRVEVWNRETWEAKETKIMDEAKAALEEIAKNE
ncbi:hypothetical protein A3F62_03825 [Candidatus Woesebacteria bacterium RIFCSPHIGHO2_12_FULL_44_11]|uniref:Transcriptional regulator MraZ n=1 Tax=Candidatus Woesebacteria bacterium RIFCSPLOWO2_01_FULL_44_14 TaxID=1802525 RepID=A0A1F8C525_9BACT|nr:MAG: hypothetical protein A3F62_03825 [Candidatus Woesebacteria bacterium RIFCSPHIGHO2_12_FULL_44_11]OGM70785.1 MAG: hypothetical protein A2975_02535 [Candidatus Woesebacteria bacterium RIFCSPLOWO2_01_FULL_44_14]